MIKITVDSDIAELLLAFGEDREATISSIYKMYRESFLAFGRQLSQDEELTIDCFQEAVISLYENLVTGKVTDQKSTIKTYLYAIGKHKIMNAQKKKKNQEQLILQNIEVAQQQKENEDHDFRKKLLSKAFDDLGERCREVLIRFYYKRYSIEAIMIDMDYKNENTVKAHKSRCMSQMRSIIKNVQKI